MKYDALGSRIKGQYEQRCRHYLPRRSYIVIRVDGRAFHAFTRRCVRPFDFDLIGDMNAVGVALCREISGAQFASIQSDEVSVLVTDFQSLQTEAWFDNSQSKIESLSASIATAAFNRSRFRRLAARDGIQAIDSAPWAEFDSRAFLVPDVNEVANVFVWRQQDAVRNSVQMVAHAHFSHAALEGKSADEMQEMLWQTHGVNWNDYDPALKRGRFVERQTTSSALEYVDKRTGLPARVEGVERRIWAVVAPPTFTRDREWLMNRIPVVRAA